MTLTVVLGTSFSFYRYHLSQSNMSSFKMVQFNLIIKSLVHTSSPRSWTTIYSLAWPSPSPSLSFLNWILSQLQAFLTVAKHSHAFSQESSSDQTEPSASQSNLPQSMKHNVKDLVCSPSQASHFTVALKSNMPGLAQLTSPTVACVQMLRFMDDNMCVSVYVCQVSEAECLNVFARSEEFSVCVCIQKMCSPV